METRLPFRQWLDENARVFRVIEGHDSGNTSYGFLDEDGRAYFCKYAPWQSKEAVWYLRNGRELAKSIRHPAALPCVGEVEAQDGYAIIYPWVEAECLNEKTPLLPEGSPDREAPDSPMSRFRRLPVQQVSAAVRQLVALHVMIEQRGYISRDWYDGCVLYDFKNAAVYAVDLDLYHRGDMVNITGREPGSSRFMAPEEFRRGATLDRRTMVYHMGATVLTLLGGGVRGERSLFRGNSEQWIAARTAVQIEPENRQQTVADLYADLYFRHR